jgi:hypothetical protein
LTGVRTSATTRSPAAKLSVCALVAASDGEAAVAEQSIIAPSAIGDTQSQREYLRFMTSPSVHRRRNAHPLL